VICRRAPPAGHVWRSRERRRTLAAIEPSARREAEREARQAAWLRARPR
jgi:hypothetical protein